MFSASVWSVKFSLVSVRSTDSDFSVWNSDFSVWLWMMSSVSMWSLKVSSVSVRSVGNDFSVWSVNGDFNVWSVDDVSNVLSVDRDLSQSVGVAGVFSVYVECGLCFQRLCGV